MDPVHTVWILIWIGTTVWHVQSDVYLSITEKKKKKKNAGNSYCAIDLPHTCMSSLVGCIWKAVWNSLNKGLIDIEVNLALPFLVHSVYRARKTCQGPLVLNDLGPSTHGFHHLISVLSSVLGVRRGITDDVATWVSYGTNLIVLVCSWLSHGVAIWVHLSFHLRPLLSEQPND